MKGAFIVHSSSSHVSYMEEVKNKVKEILDSLDIKGIFLGEGAVGTWFYHQELQKKISESDFAIVFLDGLRPNVTYELGLLHMRKIPVVPLIKKDAKISIKSFYYDIHKSDYDSEQAFGEIRYHKAAFANLVEPKFVMGSHLSDCAAMHEYRYENCDDLDKILREQIEKIIPLLTSKKGPGFLGLSFLLANFEQEIIEESIRLLSLFSVLGWEKSFPEDMTFQLIREEFLSLFNFRPISEEDGLEEKVDSLFSKLVEENILKKYGRYITVDSVNLIKESFEYLNQNSSIFHGYFTKIMSSPQTELKTRFMERIHSIDFISDEIREGIIGYVLDPSNFFQDISVLQNKESCEFFVESAFLNPLKALNLLNSWISQLTPMNIAELFPMESSLLSPGNPHDKVLWFLNETSKLESYFINSMNILLKFSLPIVVQEKQLQQSIHPFISKLALDRFLEQCYPLEGNVNVNTRWNFIENLTWNADWSEDYKNSTKDLKFRTIKAFLLRSWTVPGPVIEGRIKINRYAILNSSNYDDLESCRAKAYQSIMEWLDQSDEYEHIYGDLFNYFYSNLSEFVKYIPWEDIKSLYKNIFQEDSKKTLKFIEYIDKLKSFDTWKQAYTDENLEKIIQFSTELEVSFSIENVFRRKMKFSEYDTRIFSMFSEEQQRKEFISQVQLSLLEKYRGLTDEEQKSIIKLLFSENFTSSFDFGIVFGDSISIDDLKELIRNSVELFGDIEEGHISEFFIGLWSCLLRKNEQEWQQLLEQNWNNPNIKFHLKNILMAVGTQITTFIWGRYLNLFERNLIGPLEALFMFHKEFSEAIPRENIRRAFTDIFNKVGETIQTEKLYPIMEYARLIWRLHKILEEKEYLRDSGLGSVFLETFYPIGEELLAKMQDSTIFREMGQLAPDHFKKWLKIGFQISDSIGDHFLRKCIDDFKEEIFKIAYDLFAVDPVAEKPTENHKISYAFEVGGDSEILLAFSQEQIQILYELASDKLGYLFGRILRKLSIGDPFPPIIQRFITFNIEDTDFKKQIFRAFSSGVRTFVGTNYDLMYAGDYKKIISWQESATDQAFKDWLQELRQYIDQLKDQDREFWREREVD